MLESYSCIMLSLERKILFQNVKLKRCCKTSFFKQNHDVMVCHNALTCCFKLFFIFKANRTTHKNRKILMSYAIRNCSWKIISECLKPICLIVRSNMSVLLRIQYILTNIKLFWRKWIFLTYCNNYVHLRKKNAQTYSKTQNLSRFCITTNMKVPEL